MVLDEFRTMMGGLSVQWYRAGEEGPAVVLLHGGGIDSALLSWKTALPALEPHYQVFVPNWPGYGESLPLRGGSTAFPGESTMDSLVNTLEGLMNAWELKDAALVGLSMGGGASLGYALKNPARVRQLVLVDTYGIQRRVSAHMISYLTVQMAWIGRLSWAAIRRGRKMTRLSLLGMMHSPEMVTDDLVDEVYQMVQSPDAGAAFTSFQRNELLWNRLRTCYADRVSEIQQPTLFLHGEYDKLVPLKEIQTAVNRMPDARVEIIKGCGHWAPRENPEVFNRYLLGFLNQTA